MDTYGLFERIQADALLLLALHWIIDEDAGLEYMKLPLGEEGDVRKERAARVLERIREAEAQDEAAQNGKSAHQNKQPKPARVPSHAAHVQDAVGQQLGARLSELVSKVEEHDPLGRLLARVPRGQGPEPSRDEARLGHAEQEARGDEGAVAVLEGLKGADGAEEEELQRQPLSRADAVEDHVGGDLEEDDAEREHLLADVELVLVDADVLHEVVRDGVGDVASVEFCLAY